MVKQHSLEMQYQSPSHVHHTCFLVVGSLDEELVARMLALVVVGNEAEQLVEEDGVHMIEEVVAVHMVEMVVGNAHFRIFSFPFQVSIHRGIC